MSSLLQWQRAAARRRREERKASIGLMHFRETQDVMKRLRRAVCDFRNAQGGGGLTSNITSEAGHDVGMKSTCRLISMQMREVEKTRTARTSEMACNKIEFPYNYLLLP